MRLAFFSKGDGKGPSNLGLHNGQLAQCPDSPNCVSSQANPLDKGHYIEPLQCTVKPEQEKVVIMKSGPDYIHTEFTSKLMRFVDDMEFSFPREPLIDIRSASRLGYGDFGTNRKRIN